MPLTCTHANVSGRHAHRVDLTKATLRTDWKREQAIVDRLAPKVTRLAMRWFKGVRDQITDEAIRLAMESGDPSSIVATFEALPVPKLTMPGEEPEVRKTYEVALALEELVAQGFMDDIIEASMASGESAWAALPAAGIKLVGSFSIENPYVAPSARSRVGWLIQEVRNGTNLGLREAVAEVIERSYVQKLGWERAVKEIRGMVGLTSHQVNAVNNIAQRLADQGLSGSTLSDRIARESAKRLRYRANMIGHTEMARAVNTGRHDAWKVARDRDLFGGQEAFVEWVAGVTDRTCPICADLHGESAPLGEDFHPSAAADLSAADMSVYGETPPIHPLCRCTTILRIGARSVGGL